MFDINWSELAVIGVVALVVIGPKDLPKAMRMAGTWVRKARALAADFHHAVDQMTREAELQELKEKLAQAEASNRSLLDQAKTVIDPKGEIAQALAPPVLDAPAALAESPTAPVTDTPHGPPLPPPAGSSSSQPQNVTQP